MEDRFALIDPATYTTLTHVIWVVSAVVGIAVCFIPPVWNKAQHFGTLVHEVGHGIGGLFAGRKFTSLTLHPDSSGVTYTSGAGKLGLAFCFWSGYSAPGTLALILAAVVAAGAPGWFLVAAGGLLLLCLIRGRSVFTFLVIFGAAAGAFLLWWFPIVELQTGVLTGLFAFLVVCGIKQIGEAWGMRKRDGGEADGDALQGLLKLPEIFWLMSWHAWTAFCGIAGVALLALPAVLA